MLPANNVRMIELLARLGYSLKIGKDTRKVAEIFGFDERTVRRWNTEKQSSSTVPLCAVRFAEVLAAQLEPVYLTFAWPKRPEGGWADYQATYGSLDAAIAAPERRNAGFHIVECKAGNYRLIGSATRGAGLEPG